MLDDTGEDLAALSSRVARIVSPLQLRLLEVEGLRIIRVPDAEGNSAELKPPSLDDLLTGRVVPTLMDICAAASIAGKVSPQTLRGAGKARCIVRPRQVAMVISYQLTANNVSQIARFYRRDHTTVVHAKQAVGSLLSAQDERCLWLRQRTHDELPGIVFKRMTGERHGLG